MRSAVCLVLCLIAAVVASRQTYCVDGASMEPALPDGTVILASPFIWPSTMRGRIVVLKSPWGRGGFVTKRVAAVAGDCVTPRGELMKNGMAGCSVIPAGYYFVLGDNRPFSTDSRHRGTVRGEAMAGVVVVALHFGRMRLVFP